MGMKHTVALHRVYKYIIDEDCSYPTLVKGYDAEVEGGWVRLEKDGTIHFKSGYSYDGPSGPTKDTKNSMAPALVHDGLYQLTGEDRIPVRRNRKLADKTFRKMLKENGMGWFRRGLWYSGVRVAGWLFA
jgi:hypothetical protein